MEHPAALLGPPVAWDRVERLLVVRPDNLGDVVASGPAVRALAAAAPRARLTMLTSPAGAEVAPLLPGVDDVLCASVSWQHAGSQDVPVEHDRALLQRLAGGRFDVAVVLSSFSQSPWPAAALCRLAGIPVRVGMSKEFGGAGLTHWVPAVPDDVHQVDRALALLARVGVPSQGSHLALDVPTAGYDAAARALVDAGVPPGGRYAVVLPGASCSARRYPRMREVPPLLAAHGLRPVVVGTAHEEPLLHDVAGTSGAVVLAGRLDVPALAALLGSAAVVVSNNSGGMHVADAMGAPVVVLFAGTEQPEQYRPRSSPSRLLTVPVACSPCRQFTCPFGQECLDVEPAQVAREAVALAEPERPRLALLVVGTPRSGTTLAQRVACEVPGVAMPGETHLLQQLGPRLCEPLDLPAVDALLDLFESLPTSAGLTLDRDRVRASLPPRDVGALDVLTAVVAGLCGPQPPGTLYGEKTPEHLLWWRALTAQDPALRILGVVRDPRAVAASHRAVPWGIHDADELAEEWAFDQRRLLAARRVLGGQRCLLLRYEDLVTAPDQARTQVARLLGVDPGSGGLRAARPTIVQPWEWWKAHALDEVSADGVERWRDTLPREAAERIVAVAAPEMARLGYLSPDRGARTAPRDPDTRGRLARRLLRVRAASRQCPRQDSNLRHAV